MKAEQWAKDNGLSFPQIKGNPVIEDPNIRECYIFEDKADITCPTILHFPLVNKTFRSYLKPGKNILYVYLITGFNCKMRSKYDRISWCKEAFTVCNLAGSFLATLVASEINLFINSNAMLNRYALWSIQGKNTILFNTSSYRWRNTPYRKNIGMNVFFVAIRIYQ